MAHAIKAAQAARRARQQARKEAERLFCKLQSGSSFPTGRVIRIVYARRFRTGQCLIGALVPVVSDDVLMKKVGEAGNVHKSYEHEARLVGGGGKRLSYLRFVWRFREIDSRKDAHLLIRYANMIARHEERVWGMRAIVCPTPGIVAMHMNLQLC